MTPQPRWPKRFRDGDGDGPRDARLAALFGAWTEAGDPSEEVLRDAARVALETEPAEASFRDRLNGFRASALLRSRRVLVPLGLLAVLQIGFALAAKRGGHPLNDVRTWLRSRFAGPTPLGQPAVPVLTPSPGVAATPELPVVRGESPAPPSPPQAPIVATPSERTERRLRTIGAFPGGAHAGRGTLAPAPNPTDALATEARMVSRALALLDTDPHQTLAQLEDYRRSFPAGALHGEAALAELRAFQALGEPRAALSALDRLAAEGFVSVGGSAGELRTSRLELMTGAGRCREALDQLEPELANETSPRLQGRLLLVRASCRAATGDPAGSRRDLEQYLAVLPNGPRAAEIRRRMNGGD